MIRLQKKTIAQIVDNLHTYKYSQYVFPSFVDWNHIQTIATESEKNKSPTESNPVGLYYNLIDFCLFHCRKHACVLDAIYGKLI